MRRNRPSGILQVVVIVALGPLAASSWSWGAQGRSGGALIGTWKLDVTRSKVDYGSLPKTETRAYDVTPTGGIRLSVEGIDGTGAPYAYRAIGDIDGKDYPLLGTGTRNAGDTVSWMRVDANTVDAIVKKGSNVVNATRLLISSDGKLLTITEKGTGPNGRPTNGVRVYERQ